MPSHKQVSRSAYKEHAYQVERIAMLAEGARCSYPGCRRLADTLDHQPPLDSHEHTPHCEVCITVPMCQPHNSKGGAEYVNAKKARRIAARGAATRTTVTRPTTQSV